MVGAFADLLVRRESDPYLAVLDLRMRLQMGNGRDNGGYTRLIISTQESLAIGDDDLLSDVIQQLGEFLGREDDLLLLIEGDIAALVFHDAWCNLLSRHIRAGIQVSDKSNRWNLVCRVGRQGCHYIAILVQ